MPVTVAVAKAVTPGAHQVVLTWTDTETGVTFNIYRATISGGYTWSAPLASVAAGVLTWTDPLVGIAEGAKLFYVVTALVNGVESKPSNEMSVTVPTSPTSPVLSSAVAS